MKGQRQALVEGRILWAEEEKFLIFATGMDVVVAFFGLSRRSQMALDFSVAPVARLGRKDRQQGENRKNQALNLHVFKSIPTPAAGST